MSKSKKKFPPIFACLNLKGGVGKTTLAANISRRYFNKTAHSGVTLVDLDPQFNLSQQLLRRSTYTSLKEKKRTVAKIFEPTTPSSLFKVTDAAGPTPSLDNVSTSLLYKPLNPDVKLRLIPGDFPLVKYSLMDATPTLQKAKARFLEFIQECRNANQVVCIDCNPSSSFITLCAMEACTDIIVPVRPDRYSVLGLEILYEYMTEIITLSKLPKLHIIMNGIDAGASTSNIESQVRAHQTFGSMTLTNRVYRSRLLEATHGFTGFATDRKVAYRYTVMRNLDSVTAELQRRL